MTHAKDLSKYLIGSWSRVFSSNDWDFWGLSLYELLQLHKVSFVWSWYTIKNFNFWCYILWTLFILLYWFTFSLNIHYSSCRLINNFNSLMIMRMPICWIWIYVVFVIMVVMSLMLVHLSCCLPICWPLTEISSLDYIEDHTCCEYEHQDFHITHPSARRSLLLLLILLRSGLLTWRSCLCLWWLARLLST